MRYLVIGAGVIGATIARELAMQKKGEVVVLEKESKVGLHTSGRNSGVIHSGINQKPNSLKAELCVEGSRLLREYCLEKDVPMQQVGTIVVANSDEEISRLNGLYGDALLCNVPGVRYMSAEELKEREPFAKGLSAIISPTGAIVDAKGLMLKLSEEIKSLGAQIEYNTKVNSIRPDSVQTDKGEFKFDKLINCSGLHVDKLAHTSKSARGYAVIPFRGDYMQVEAEVNSMIYHVPDRRFPFLGVHLTKTIDGKVIAGPTATLSFAGREGYDRRGLSRKFFSETLGLNFLAWAARSLLSPSTMKQVCHNLRISLNQEAFLRDIHSIYNGEIDMSNAKPYSSGIRPQIVSRTGRLIDDFTIENKGNQLHVLNAVSPGFTSSMALAKYVVDNYINHERS